jgi:hypothetical protein
MAGLDQRLTVFEDGRVSLEDRKARDRSQVEAASDEIARLRSLLDAVPDDAWHGIAGALARGMAPRPHEGMRFELRRGSRRISGYAGRHDADVAPVLAALDELLGRAVRERRG